MRPDINHKKKSVKNTNSWRLNNELLNNQEITKKSKRKSKTTWKQMTMETQQPKTYGMQQKQFKREVYSNTILPQETRNISSKQPNLTTKAIRERRTKNIPKLAEGKKS